MGVYKQEFIHLYMAYMTFLVECTVQLNIFMAIAPCERDFADFLKCPPRLRDRFTIFIAQNVNTENVSPVRRIFPETQKDIQSRSVRQGPRAGP